MRRRFIDEVHIDSYLANAGFFTEELEGLGDSVAFQATMKAELNVVVFGHPSAPVCGIAPVSLLAWEKCRRGSIAGIMKSHTGG